MNMNQRILSLIKSFILYGLSYQDMKHEAVERDIPLWRLAEMKNNGVILMLRSNLKNGCLY